MSTLVAIGYNDADKAEEVRLMLRTMKKDYLIDIEDAVVAVKDEKGKIRLNQSVSTVGAGALTDVGINDGLKGTGGKILRSNLSHENEARLQQAISAAKAA
jgi:uncharacterized membrane protein